MLHLKHFEEENSLRQENWELCYLVVELSLFQYEREQQRLSKIKSLERPGN